MCADYEASKKCDRGEGVPLISPCAPVLRRTLGSVAGDRARFQARLHRFHHDEIAVTGKSTALQETTGFAWDEISGIAEQAAHGGHAT